MQDIEKFLLRDSDHNNNIVGLITYLHKENRLIIEPIIPKSKKMLYNYPLDLQLCIQRGYKQVPDEWVKEWLDERVVPPERPGVLEALQKHGIKEYNQIEIMKIVKGKNSMDGTYWEKVSNEITIEKITLE